MNKEELKTFEDFRNMCCIKCNNDFFCPSDCEFLERASKIQYSRLLDAYIRNNEDLEKVKEYVKYTRCIDAKGEIYFEDKNRKGM